MAFVAIAMAATDGSLRAERVQGVVISCPSWGWEWGTDEMVATMRDLKEIGVSWVQIHPYIQIDREGSTSLRGMPEDGSAPEWLSRPIREAHALGLKIAIVPHVAGWRAGWSWRGDIAFESREGWRRFFESYEKSVVRLARHCRDADAFSVGSELDRTVAGHEREWRQIIAGARAETKAALTYGANWDGYRKIPFWDALDAISLSAYFPLVNHGRRPVAGELDAAWAKVHRQLAA